MAEVADSVDRSQIARKRPGKWKFAEFATYARNILSRGGTELHNAYILK